MNRFVTLAGERIGDLIGHAVESGRLVRGRALFRKGSVSELTVTSGQISAVVQGSTGTPYDTTVAASLAAPGVIREVAEGYDPEDRHCLDDLIDDGVHIVPRLIDLAYSCSCSDWDDPCKHAAAVLFAFADRVDLDEVELLRWRGIDYSTSSGEGASEALDEAEPADSSERAAAVDGLRGLLGETAPSFGRRRTGRPPPAPEPNSPALQAFLGEDLDPAELDLGLLAPAPPLFTDIEGGLLAELGPQLADALSIIVGAVAEEQAERQRLARSRS